MSEPREDDLLARMETFADHGCSPNNMRDAQELIADALLGIQRLHLALAAKPERGRVIEFALQPFIDGLSGTEAAKMIDKRYPGLSPIQIVVTKFQYQAAKDALKGTPA